MRPEITLDAVAQVTQKDAHSFPTREFEGRDQVAIPSHHYDRFH
jgi:hypothetical protein